MVNAEMVRARQSEAFLVLLLRGVVGGLIGGFVFAGVEICLLRPTGWDNWIGYFILIFMIGGLPFGVLIGAVQAVVVWLINQQTGVRLGPFAMPLFGTVLGMILIGIWWTATANRYQQSYEKSSWTVYIFGLFLLGAAFGGIPGLVIGARRRGAAHLMANKLGKEESQVTKTATDR